MPVIVFGDNLQKLDGSYVRAFQRWITIYERWHLFRCAVPSEDKDSILSVGVYLHTQHNSYFRIILYSCSSVPGANCSKTGWPHSICPENMTEIIKNNEMELNKEVRKKRVLSRMALFLGELRDGLTMVSFMRSVDDWQCLSGVHTHIVDEWIQSLILSFPWGVCFVLTKFSSIMHDT